MQLNMIDQIYTWSYDTHEDAQKDPIKYIGHADSTTANLQQRDFAPSTFFFNYYYQMEDARSIPPPPTPLF